MPSIDYVPDFYRKYFGDTANTVFDIGSRDGDDAKLLSDQLKVKNTYIFECHPECFKRIDEKYPEFNNIRIAVSNFTGQSIFNAVYTNDIEMGVSSMKDRNDDWYDVRNADRITVNVDTIKNLIDFYKIPRPIDLVKIDVEGCTFEVLEGFEQYLDEVKMFHMEVEEVAIWQGQHLFDEIISLMINHDFVLVDNRYYGPHSADHVWINKRFMNDSI
jgi:FkbM family methyltransferase